MERYLLNNQKQGYRCDLCLVKFHQRCWSRVPTYCDKMAQCLVTSDMMGKIQNVLSGKGASSLWPICRMKNELVEMNF